MFILQGENYTANLYSFLAIYPLYHKVNSGKLSVNFVIQLNSWKYLYLLSFVSCPIYMAISSLSTPLTPHPPPPPPPPANIKKKRSKIERKGKVRKMYFFWVWILLDLYSQKTREYCLENRRPVGRKPLVTCRWP